jgi:hypothetical protein
LKKLILNHSFTPLPLESINRELSELEADNDSDDSTFLKLVIAREEFILKYLQTLPDEEKTNFVAAELQVNGALVAYAEESFKASLKQLSDIVRGRKAVKKYR